MVVAGTDAQMNGAVNTVKGDVIVTATMTGAPVAVMTATITDAPVDAMIAVHAVRIDRRANVRETEAGVRKENREIEVVTANGIAIVAASGPEVVINVIKAAAEAKNPAKTDIGLEVGIKVVVIVINHAPNLGARTMEAVGTTRNGTDPRVRTQQGLHQRRTRSATSRQSLCLQKTAAWSAGGLGTEVTNGETR